MDWNGTSPYGGVSGSQKEFPSVLPLSEATDWIEGTSSAEVLLGVDALGDPVTVDLDSEDPHILVSARTGRGKSAIARSVAVQRLAKGDLVVFLDLKRHSHRWAQALAPNVRYAKEIQGIGHDLCSLGHELHRRNHVIDEWSGPVETAPVGPRVIVVFEEMNATMGQLKALDRQYAQDGMYTASQGLADLSFMGRAARMHLVSFAQLATYKASGGSEVIENYGTRILVGYSDLAWKYLARECGRYRPAPEQKGRGMVCRDGKARETQLLWVPEEAAAPFVTASIPAQKRARELSGGSLRATPDVWRQAIGR